LVSRRGHKEGKGRKGSINNGQFTVKDSF